MLNVGDADAFSGLADKMPACRTAETAVFRPNSGIGVYW